MEAMNLVEVVLNHGNDEDAEKITSNSPSIIKSSPIKGLDESVTITVTRTPSKPINVHRQSGKPANFALMSPVRNGRNSDAIRLTPREEMVCGCCQRIFKYKAAFMRHEAQCGLPVALKMERAALIEAKKAEKVAEIEKRKIEEKQEKEKLPELRCPTCLKQFTENDSFKSHNFQACAAERATYTFVCSVCKARFKYKNHLRRHEDSHNNVRRYNCDVCTTAFLRPDHLKRHMMRMHGVVTLPYQSSLEEMTAKPSPGLQAVQTPDEKKAHTITKTTPMQCPMCNKILSRRDHVLRHMRNVHHISYEARTRGSESDLFPGLAGLMDLDHSNSNQDDEDGSENQSMTSHDGLLIDESFESVKTDCESFESVKTVCKSSNPDLCAESKKSTDKINVIPPSKLFRESYNSDELTIKKINYPFAQTPSLSHPMETAFHNGKGKKNEVSTLAMDNGPEATEKVNSDTSLGFGHVMKSECVAEGKAGHIGTSDGNQNVLSNGLVSQSAGEDWISDLAKYSGW